eukprot:126425_1
MRFVPSTNDVKDISSQSKEIISKIQKKRIKRNYNLKTSTISQMVMRLIKSQLIHKHLLCFLLAIMNVYVYHLLGLFLNQVISYYVYWIRIAMQMLNINAQ